MLQPEGRSAIILLVEDDLGDQELTRRAFEESKISNNFRIVNDGEEAMDYLLHQGMYEDLASSPRPDLILLDLNMPKLDGRQVLDRMRQIPELRTIPVIVLTTSRQEQDIVRSYDLGCNSFIVKPVDIGQFMLVIKSLEEYWFQVVVLPSAMAA